MLLIKCRCGTDIQLKNDYFLNTDEGYKALYCPFCKVKMDNDAIYYLSYLTRQNNDENRNCQVFILPDSADIKTTITL